MVVPQKVKTRFTILPSNSTSGISPKEMTARPRKVIHAPTFIAALSELKHGGNPSDPWVGEWISTIWCVHAVEEYPGLERKEILSHAITCMNLEDIMLSEVSQSQKNESCMIPHFRGT